MVDIVAVVAVVDTVAVVVDTVAVVVAAMVVTAVALHPLATVHLLREVVDLVVATSEVVALEAVLHRLRTALPRPVDHLEVEPHLLRTELRLSVDLLVEVVDLEVDHPRLPTDLRRLVVVHLDLLRRLTDLHHLVVDLLAHPLHPTDLRRRVLRHPRTELPRLAVDLLVAEAMVIFIIYLFF